MSGGMYGDTSLTNVTCLVSKQVVSYFFINERAPLPSPEGLHSASSSLALLLLTPSQLQPVQGGKMQSYTHANSIFDGPITNLLSILCVLIGKSFHMLMKKKKKKKKKRTRKKTDRQEKRE